jgi:hypothetical protein
MSQHFWRPMPVPLLPHCKVGSPAALVKVVSSSQFTLFYHS